MSINISSMTSIFFTDEYLIHNVTYTYTTQTDDKLYICEYKFNTIQLNLFLKYVQTLEFNKDKTCLDKHKTLFYKVEK